jgi:pantoate kinase|tara:strand:- start:1120 stop:1956 length:837 start_codon:yes stop_codon:yes gene_type:complete
MSSKVIRAFAPGNISCIFVIRKNKNLEKSGSLGVGFTINKGAIVSVKKCGGKKNLIYFNNKNVKFPTVNWVVKKLTNEKISVDIKSKLPLGCGFGISGAGALATTYALNKLLNLKKSKKDLAFIAHVAEVENMTGLGDVVNQYYGGFLIKYKSSYMFKVKKVSIKNKVIYYKNFGKLDTKKVISNKKSENKINKAGLNSLKKIKNDKNINLKEIIKISKEFSIKSDLLQSEKIINLIKKIERGKGNASMIMLGEAVFSDRAFKGSKKLVIKDKGAYIL